MGQSQRNFTNAVPELLILHLIAEQDMYGYEIVRSIRERTDNVLKFGEGCLYPILHNLKRNGLVRSREQLVAGRRRIYYRATPKGARKLQTLRQQWQHTTDAITQALHHTSSGANHAKEPAMA